MYCKCVYCVIIASGAAYILLYWAMLNNSDQSTVRNATRVNKLVAREETQIFSNDYSSVQNDTLVNKMVNGLMARDENDRLGVLNGTGVNKLMVGEERQRVNTDRIGVQSATGVKRLMTGEERQRLNNDRIGGPIATWVNRLMAREERQRFNNDRIGVPIATGVNRLMAGEERQRLNIGQLGVPIATGVNRLMAGEERQRLNIGQLGVPIATGVNRLMAGEERQMFNIDRLGVPNVTGINGMVAGEERQRLNNDRLGVPSDTRVNRLMAGEERQRLNNDRLGVPSDTRVNRLMAGEERQRFNIDQLGVPNVTGDNGMVAGEERQRVNIDRLGVPSATGVNILMAREERQRLNNDHIGVPSDTRVNRLMAGEESRGFNNDRLGVPNATGVNGMVVGEKKQIFIENGYVEVKGAKPARKEINRRFVKYNYFTKMKFGPVYIFGVTLGNTTSTAHWDVIKIRASMGLIYAKETHFICCIKYIDLSYYTSQPVTAFNIRHPRESLSAVHFTCRNPRPGVVPSGVALALNNQACSDEHVTYRIPETPKREPGVKLAICTKLAYGNRNAEMLIEFMELYKYLGVDKFVTYFLKDLNKDARKVLEYYASTGILDLYYFEPAEEGTIKRSFHPPGDQSRSDKQLLIFDAFERMSGYTYFGIIDHDEFLIPSKDRSLKDLLADLFVKNYNAAGFTFQSKHYCVNKGRQGTINDLMLGQFVTTSTKEPEYFAQKNIYKPMYMNHGRIHTHYPRTKSFVHKMVEISAKEGYIRHFRHCPYNYPKHFPLDRELINDNWVAEWSRRIQHNVENVRYHVFGSSKYVIYPKTYA